MSKKAKAVLLVSILIVILVISGFIYDYTRVKSTLSSLEMKDIGIESIRFNGYPIPTKVYMDVLLRVRNPTNYIVTIDKLKYDFYINNELVAQGIKHDIVIYASSNTDIVIPVNIYTLDTVKTVLESLKNGVANIKVRGFMEIPIRWFGVIRSFTVGEPYSISRTIKINVPGLPIKIPIKVINAEFKPSVAVQGKNVSIIVGLECNEKLTYNIKVVIKEDIAYGFDKVVYAYTTAVKFPGYRIVKFTWVPPESSHGRLRGYYIEIYADNHKIYSMPFKYPPRLKVLEQNPITTHSANVGKLLIVDEYWVVNGVRSYRAHVGDNVEGCIILFAKGGSIHASVRIQIKKDLRFRPDKVVIEKYFTIALNPDEEKTLCVFFIAQERSGTWFRGYYIEIYVNGNKFYIMPNGYPPRLKVS